MNRTLFATLLSVALGSVAYAHPAEAPNDAQIAHVAYTAGAIDVAAAEQALAKSSNAAVRAFAETMRRDHAAVNERALALVEKLGVTPAPNATSAALSGDATQKLAKFGDLSGAAFDRAYVANEVDFHRTVNNVLSTSLIPGSTNLELKDLLETGLALFQAHQRHAEQLAQQLR